MAVTADLYDYVVEYWDLEEDDADRVGEKNGNILTNINSVPSGTGKVGNAAEFEAANQEQLENGSTALWTPTGSWSVFQWVLGMGATGTVWAATVDASGDRSWNFGRIDPLGDNWRFAVSGDGSGLTSVAESAKPGTSTWALCLYGYDDANSEIFLQMAWSTVGIRTRLTAPFTGPVHRGSSKLIIGGSGFGSNWFRSSIDETAFLNGWVATEDDFSWAWNDGDGRTHSEWAALTAASGESPFRDLAPGSISRNRPWGSGGHYNGG